MPIALLTRIVIVCGVMMTRCACHAIVRVRAVASCAAISSE